MCCLFSSQLPQPGEPPHLGSKWLSKRVCRVCVQLAVFPLIIIFRIAWPAVHDDCAHIACSRHSAQPNEYATYIVHIIFMYMVKEQTGCNAVLC